MKNEDFYNQKIEELRQEGVTLKLSESDHILYMETRCSGFFIDSPLTFALAKGRKDSFEIFLHEYSHFTQYKENSPFWTGNKIHSFEAGDIIDLWISGKVDLNPVQLDDIFRRVMAVEYDCEQRTVQLIKDNSLDVNIENYIKKANAYVLSYQLVKKYRRWYVEGMSPYSVESIIEKMPSEWKDINEVLSEELEIAFRPSFFK